MAEHHSVIKQPIDAEKEKQAFANTALKNLAQPWNKIAQYSTGYSIDAVVHRCDFGFVQIFVGKIHFEGSSCPANSIANLQQDTQIYFIGQPKELLKYKAAAQTNNMMPRNPTASSSTVFNLERFFLSVGSLFEL